MTTRSPITNTLLSTGGKLQESTNKLSINTNPFFDSIKVSKSSRIVLAEWPVHEVQVDKGRRFFLAMHELQARQIDSRLSVTAL